MIADNVSSQIVLSLFKWFNQVISDGQLTWSMKKGMGSFVDVWLSSKAINTLWADSQFRPKFNGWGNPRGNLPRYKEDILPGNQ